MKIITGNRHDKGDGILYFKTVTGEKGHIVLHMTDSVLVNTKTNELTMPNFHHDMPKVIVDEIFINLATNFYEVKIEPIDNEHIEIICEWIKR